MKIEIARQTVTEDIAASWPIRQLAGLLVLAVASGLVYVVMSLSVNSPSLQGLLAERMPESGVSHAVTAVLLNFRGYDTLLETSVLLLVVSGVWSLAVAPEPRQIPAGPVQDSLARLLLPLIILTAGYLLWAGSHAPGGAFQAGALVTAGGILLLLSGWRLPPAFKPWLLRLVMIAGIAVFIGVAVSMLGTQTFLLTYPPQWAGDLMLLIEFCATVSIGVMLVILFIGGRP